MKNNTKQLTLTLAADEKADETALNKRIMEGDILRYNCPTCITKFSDVVFCSVVN